jgi:CubicO group peptidase (beta-lactamase class C family)
MSRILTAVAFLWLVSSIAVAAPERSAEAFVHYWNAGDDRAAINSEVFTDDFIARRGEEGLAQMMRMVYGDNGDIAVHSITRATGDSVRFLVSSEKGNWLDIGLDLAGDGRIGAFGVQFTTPPPVGSEQGLDGSEIAKRVRDYVDGLAEKGAFSGAVLLAKDFEPVLAKSYGLADRETGRANTLDTPINLGSMNKMFTGLAITQLVAEGKLAYDDPVGKYLPDYPNQRVRDTVSIHQLLTHTSGLGSYWNARYDERKNTLQSLDDFAALFVDDPLAFEPGEAEQYSNAGPVVLGLIIKSVSGQDYYAFIRERVYSPAGMDNSGHFDKFENQSGKANGYYVPEGGSEPISNFDDLGRIGSAAGGGYASANDLLRFARALYDGTLIDAEHREIMTTFKVPWGAEGGYGYLFADLRINGQRFIGHNGGAPGINAEFSHFPELGYTLIVLSNLDRAATPVADQVRTWIGYSNSSGAPREAASTD